MMNKPIAIIGGGNGGQAFAGWLALRGYKTRLFDVVQETCDKLNEKGGVEIVGNASAVGFGKIEFASTDMGKVMDGCELVMVVLPSIYHKAIATEMAKHLVDGQILMLNPNASLGVLEFRKTLDDCGCKADILMGASCTLLFSCRAVEVGKVNVMGQKNTLTATAFPSCNNAILQEKLKEVFPAYAFDADVIKVSLDNMNAFVHPGTTLLNTGRIESGIKFNFYHEMTPSQGKLIDAIDKERCAIARAYGVDLPTIVQEYHDQYDSKGETAYEVMSTCKGYVGSAAPNSLTARYVTEDIPYSLEAICAMADIAGVATPCMKAIITIGRAILGDKLDEGRTAKNLGIEGMTKEEFLKLCRG
jgi:opine dehydrogenase